MTDRPENPPDLPPDLARLDRELSSIRIEERASFGPELASELAKAHAQGPVGPTPVRFVRGLIAAGIAVVAIGSMAVPPARAALARFLVRVQEEATSVLAFSSDDLPDPVIGLDQPESAPASSFAGSLEPVPEPRLVLLGVDPEEGAAPAITFPELQNRSEVEELVQSLYPPELQKDGVGGEVRLLLWVDSTGIVEEARVGSSAGVAALDRAALATAQYLRFEPAHRQGLPVGSWLQFDVTFEPSGLEDAPLPDVEPIDQPAVPEVRTPDLVPEWMRTTKPLPPPDRGAQIELLREAMGDEREIEERWGSLEGLLAGEAPESALPLAWRSEAAAALEAAIVRDPGNPAPFLALGRIRRKQGLRGDARRLFERGIDRAESSSEAVPAVVAADLYYEHGLLIAEEWLPWSNLGQVASGALHARRCDQARSREPAATHASSATLIAWNYLCPTPFAAVMRSDFEDLESLKHGVRDEMIRSWMAAVEVSPGHVGANVELLLDLADSREYEELLAQAQRFALASGGHPNALLLAGLALHRLGRSNEAQTQFRLAYQRLSPAVVEEIRDLSPLISGQHRASLPPLGTRERVEFERRFWSTLDPLLATPVNEREVEHAARAAYAHLRFGGAGTDPGQVWVRYGRPDAVRAVRDGAGLRTVFWDYGPGPDITFRRPATTLSFELTAEGKAYADELMDVFPHRYDTGRGRILSIVSQSARFRLDDRAGTEVEVHAQVPPELMTGAGDSIDVGLYLTGPEGERWVVTRRRIPADAKPIHLSAVPTSTSDRVVLELFHTGLDRAARLELPVARQARLRGPAISDLMLVDPVAPYSAQDASRGSSLIEARPRPEFVRGQQGGVVFELYELTGNSVTYRLSSRFENLETGEQGIVAVKPAGELEFRTRWTRSRRGADRLPEYLTLDLADLGPGRYLIEVRVRPLDHDDPLEASRVVEIL